MSEHFKIRPATKTDIAKWAQLRHALWPDLSVEGHMNEIREFFFSQHPASNHVALAFDQDDRALGMIEISIRPCAEGCVTSNVLYLEGWYVAPEVRKTGLGRMLVNYAIRWGKEQGCTEFASDAETDNEQSIKAHLALGFEDVGLVRCFKMKI